MPMRIHMVFGETSILVPCGDGKLAVSELVEKAVVKFKKFIAKHPEDVVEVRSVRLLESGSLVDEDDEVADVLEDKDTVVLDYEYYPHTHSNSLRDVSISDDSAIVGSSSQPYSPGNLDNEVDYTANGPTHPPLSDKDYEDDQEDELPPPKSQEDTGGTPRNSPELHMPLSGHSQELPGWTPLTASQESPHTHKNSWHGNEPSTREILDNQPDSGYNTRSQASYGPESQEAYATDLSQGHTGTSPRTTHTRLSTRERSGSQTNLVGKSKGHRGSREDLLKNNSPPGSKASLFKASETRRTDLPSGGRYPVDHHTHGMDIPPNRFTRPNLYGGYSFDGRPYPHPPFDARMHPPSDYPPYGSWSYHSDLYYRPQYLMPGRRPMDYPRDRRELQGARTLSTERLDQVGYPGNRGFYGYRQGIEEEFLSQPNPSFVPPVGLVAGYDPRYPMGGPSPGVILSQPAVMSGRGLYDSMERRGNKRRGYSIDDDLDHLDVVDELDQDEGHSSKGRVRPSPFQRNTRKSMVGGALYSQWMEHCYEYGIQGEDENSDLPEYDAGHSQRSRSPSPTPPTDHTHHGDESEEDDEFGNIHIVELHKGNEPLGVYLTHYTSPDGRDLGVFIGDMDSSGFAAQSGQLQVQDRILACNGVDFTKEMTNTRVEEIFTQMTQEPLLRMAISRGAQGNLVYTAADGVESGGVSSESEVKDLSEPKDPGTPKIVLNTSQPPSLTLTNTRQIGVKHTITLTKTTPTSSLGFGVTSRDVMTDNQNVPFYIKSITSGTPAFTDGRLKIGDRLLEVNGQEVTGLSRAEVVGLLREPRLEVTLVVSRQEVVEEGEAEELLSSAHSSATTPSSTTVGKTVLTLDIPLSNTGSAGLGVTVYGRTTLGSVGDMGIYIKSIVPGGAAALDGRLRKNDQLLCVNKEGLLGSSNQEALDKLRTALTKASSKVGEANEGGVELVVARRMCNTGSSQSPSMTALGEEPEEEEKADNDKGREVGIDVPIEAHPPPALSTPSLVSQGSQDSRHSDGKMERLITQTSIDSLGNKDSSRASSMSPRIRSRGQEVAEVVAVKDHSLLPKPLKRAEDLMGSGEFDRLEPLIPPPQSPARGRRNLEQSTELRSQRSMTPQSPLSMQERLTSWYDDTASSVLTSMDPRMRAASVDRYHPPSRTPEFRGQRSYNKSESYSNHQRGYSDESSRYRPPLMSYDLRGASPSDIESQLSSGQSSQTNSLHRNQQSPRYDYNYHGNQYQFPSNQPMFQSYGEGSAPTRGSGRKDRNRPERGSGRHQTTPHYSSSSASPSISLMMSPDVTDGSPLSNGYATIPRTGSRSSQQEVPVDQSNADTSSLCSLEHLRLSDSESNAAFRRDEPGRISITKKTKKNPRRDFAHMQLDNVEPLVEGEAPVLIRTGSDSCINDSAGNSFLQHSMHSVTVGPQLGLAKSSSLESLHNVMMHTIKRDLVDDGRSRAQTIDSATSSPSSSKDKKKSSRADASYDLESGSSVPAVMSYTKNPGSRKKKSGFFKKVFKKKNKNSKKDRPASIATPTTLHKRVNSVDTILEQSNFSEAEKELLKTGFTIPVRLGDNSVDDIRIPGDSRYSNSGVEPQRHSMPIIDDYDSPGSPADEAVLSTMAKV